MRISDWSSDVCSSDLVDTIFEPPQFSAARLNQQKQSERITHLKWFLARLSIADDDIRKWHYSWAFPPSGPHGGGHSNSSPMTRPPKWPQDMLGCRRTTPDAIGKRTAIYHSFLRFSKTKDRKSEKLRVGKECVSKCKSRW